MTFEKQKDYHYRIRYIRKGDHVHCRIFSKPRDQSTWGKCGDLVLRYGEWTSFRMGFPRAEFIPEEEA